MTDTTKQIDRQALLVLAADAGFSVVGCSFVMPTHSGHITEEIEKFAELLAARATPVSPAQSDPVFVNQLQEAIFAARSIDGREDYWNDVLARLGVTAPAKPHSDLHSAIMNLPCKVPEGYSEHEILIYKFGDRDARHAAAELVAASVGAQVAKCACGHTEHECTDTADGKPLCSAPVPAPATVDRDAVLEEMAELVNELACGDDPLAPEEVRDKIRALKGKAAPAPVPQGVFALCRKCNGSGLNGRVGAAPECPACKGEGFAPQGEAAVRDTLIRAGETPEDATRMAAEGWAKAQGVKRKTWKTDGGYRCLNCGQVLTHHEGQMFCPLQGVEAQKGGAA